jgi:hypothetical protein
MLKNLVGGWPQSNRVSQTKAMNILLQLVIELNVNRVRDSHVCVVSSGLNFSARAGVGSVILIIGSVVELGIARNHA